MRIILLLMLILSLLVTGCGVPMPQPTAAETLQSDSPRETITAHDRRDADH